MKKRIITMGTESDGTPEFAIATQDTLLRALEVYKHVLENDDPTPQRNLEMLATQLMIDEIKAESRL